MPTYEYECNTCHFHFDKRQGFDDKPLAECPKCEGTSRRVFSPTPIIFKGSGFYVTDSRKPGGDGSGESGESTKTDESAKSDESTKSAESAGSTGSGSDGEKTTSKEGSKGAEG